MSKSPEAMRTLRARFCYQRSADFDLRRHDVLVTLSDRATAPVNLPEP
jgi:hypothetical protein